MQSSQQISRINDVLYYIHQDISQPLLAKELAGIAAYSEQHFHRIFKQIVGESVHFYIKRTRLEFAANQLMFDIKSTVLDIANKSGFLSVSSFSRAFKELFGMSPGEWRNSEVNNIQQPYIHDAEIAEKYQSMNQLNITDAIITELPARQVAYVRHQGYNRSIKMAWQTLIAWAKTEGRDYEQQFGLHHSNPAWVALSKCRYVACIEIDQPLKRRGIVNSLTIPGGLHATFKLTGKYGELLPQLSHILERWLPASGFKMQATPAYVSYRKNHFITSDERFELTFCLPISLYH